MMTPAEVVQVLRAEAEHQQNVTPRLRVEVATDDGPRTVYLRPALDERPGLVEFVVWAWTRGASRGILSVRGA